MKQIPLAERMRPSRIEDLLGQKHLTGQGSVLQRAIVEQRLPSMILWGAPGVGKTSIAHIIAQSVQADFFQLSAINSGVKDIREVLDQAKSKVGSVLFIDEIHRFNKGQQDALLSAVEKGVVTLIGATTENPSFEINNALLSRCQVFLLNPLKEEDLNALLVRALKEDPILAQIQIELAATGALLRLSDGDARKLLNLFELVVENSPVKPVVITDELVLQTVQQKMMLYDQKGEQHYDLISAFIKSIRGSDPNAAVYWLARMIEGGEDVKFIARRMLILAGEDIGNANPNALLLANSTFDAVVKIGLPEARILLSQCATYLAASPKSNAAYKAINFAMEVVQKTGNLPVPLSIRNAPTALMKELNYGKGYKYAHDYQGHFAEQEFLPDQISGTVFYEPGDNARENEIRQFLKCLWKDRYHY